MISTEFLKNQDKNISCTQFKKEMKDYIDEISEDEEFKKEILLHKDLCTADFVQAGIQYFF